MTIDTQVFTRIVKEAREAEHVRGIKLVAEVMAWTTRYGGFTDEYRAHCAEILYSKGDCKQPL